MKASEATTVTENGFRSCFYPANLPTDRCLIVLLGDDPDDLMDRACARWLTEKEHCHALCLAVRQNPQDDTGIHGWPLEYVEKAVHRLREKNMKKIGIFGMSMQAALALTAASLIPELSLVIALAPCDFVPWGFVHGTVGRSRNAEWPSGGSAFTWRGEELPYQPAYLEKEAYWNLYCEAQKKFHEMHSVSVFDYSEAASPVPEQAKIRAEQIRGKIVLVGAEDDSMWNSAKYIRRLKQRLEEKAFAFPAEVFLYPYATHLLVPDSMLRYAVPLIGGIVPRMFASGRKHPKECRQARRDLEEKLSAVLCSW